MQADTICLTGEWQSFNLKENVKGGPAPRSTSVAMCLRGDTVYLRFECEDDFILSRGITYNAKLYEGDVAELFITLGRPERYLELEVNPDGARYAVIVGNEGGSLSLTPLSDCPFSSKTERYDGGWRTEWRIPLSALKALGYEEANAAFNIYRQDFREDGTLMLYALNPTHAASFHIPSAFLPLEL